MTFFFRVQTAPRNHGGLARTTAPVVESGTYVPPQYAQADRLPPTESAPLASNVRSGYGLFGGATNATYRNQIFQPRP